MKSRGSRVVGPGTLIVFERGQPLGSPGNAHFGFRVGSSEEVEAWAEKFAAVVESDSTYAGFKATDPEGNRFEIYWERE